MILMTGYFEELLERIRDIRASERLFYQKMMEQKAHQEFKTYAPKRRNEVDQRLSDFDKLVEKTKKSPTPKKKQK
jgi:hypothetical protein